MNETIINLIEQLQIAGYTKEQIAAAFGCSVATIRRYAAGQIPTGKQQRFIYFVKQNYRGVYDYVIGQKD